MPIDLKTTLANPDFQSLPETEKRQFVEKYVPEFGGLPKGEQDKFFSTYIFKNKAAGQLPPGVSVSDTSSHRPASPTSFTDKVKSGFDKVKQWDKGFTERLRASKNPGSFEGHPENVGEGFKTSPITEAVGIGSGGKYGSLGELTRAQVGKQGDDSRWMLNTMLDLGVVSGDVMEGLTTPESMALLGGMKFMKAGTLAKKLIDGGFSAQMAYGAAKGIKAGYDEAKKGNLREAGRLWAQADVDAVFSFLSGRGATEKTAPAGGTNAERLKSESRTLPPERLPKREGPPPPPGSEQTMQGTKMPDTRTPGQKRSAELDSQATGRNREAARKRLEEIAHQNGKAVPVYLKSLRDKKAANAAEMSAAEQEEIATAQRLHDESTHEFTTGTPVNSTMAEKLGAEMARVGERDHVLSRLDRLAEQNMYVDADDMVQSLGQKNKGRWSPMERQFMAQFERAQQMPHGLKLEGKGAKSEKSSSTPPKPPSSDAQPSVSPAAATSGEGKPTAKPANGSGATDSQIAWFAGQLPQGTFSDLESEMAFGDHAHVAPKIMEDMKAQGLVEAVEPRKTKGGKKVAGGWKLTAKGRELAKTKGFQAKLPNDPESKLRDPEAPPPPPAEDPIGDDDLGLPEDVSARAQNIPDNIPEDSRAENPVRVDHDSNGNVVDGDGRHRIIAALERGDETIPIQTKLADGTTQTLNVSPQVAAEKLGVTPESLKATDEQQSAFQVDGGVPPDAAAEAGKPPAGEGQALQPSASTPENYDFARPSELVVDPQRMQFRIKPRKSGIEEAKEFSPEKAGLIMVWRDPSTGKDIVVDGHHRVNRAIELGFDEKLPVYRLQAGSAEEARAMGAGINIEQGNADAIDAAVFFRSGRDKGLAGEMTGPVAKAGRGLAALDEEHFNDVLAGDLKENIAAEVGNGLTDHESQNDAFKYLARLKQQGKRLTPDLVKNIIDRAQNAPRVEDTQEGLFGPETTSKTYLYEEAKATDGFRKRITEDSKLHGFLAVGDRAQKIAQATGRIVEPGKLKGKSAELSESAKMAGEVFDRLSQRGGVINDIIAEAGKRIAEGENERKVIDQLYERVRSATDAELRGGNDGPPPPPSGDGSAVRADDAGAGRENQAGVSEAAEAGQVAPKAAEDSLFGSKNKWKTREQAEAAKKLLAEELPSFADFLKDEKGELDTSRMKDLPPKLMRAAVDLGMYYMEAGFREFKDWAREMRSAQPEFTPWLKAIWDRTQEFSKYHETGYDPKGLQKQLSKLYDYPVTRNIASMLEVPKGAILKAGADIVDDRVNFANTLKYDADLLAHKIERSVAKDELAVEKMGYALQDGGKGPVYDSLSPQAKQAVKWIQEYNQTHDAILREIYGDELPLHDSMSYLSQIWEFGEGEGTRERAFRGVLRDPFLKKRTVEDYRTGIEQLGLTPKFNKITDIIRTRAEWMSEAAANYRMARLMSDFGYIMDPGSAEAAGITGWPEASDSPTLRKAVHIGTTKAGDSILERKPVLVNPEMKQAVDAVFAQGWNQRDPMTGKRTVYGMLEPIRATTKKTVLALSFFHHWALSEQNWALYGMRHPVKAVKGTWFLNPDFYKGTGQGLVDVFGGKPGESPRFRWKPELVREAINNGLEMQTRDAEAAITKTLRNVGINGSKMAQAAGVLPRRLGDLAYIHDSGLWRYFHEGSMLEAYHTLKADEITKLTKGGKQLTPEESEQVGRQVAKVVNDAFGSINMMRLLQSKKAMQVMDFTILAPAWTLSNIRLPLRMAERGFGGKMSQRYVRNAAATFFLSTQLFNYALTSYYNMEDKNGKKGGHFSWDNGGAPVIVGPEKRFMFGAAFGAALAGPAGAAVGGTLGAASSLVTPELVTTENAINIGAGYNPDGTQRYIRFGKGNREFFAWQMEPDVTLGSKIGLLPRQVFVQGTGRAPGSDYSQIDQTLPSWSRKKWEQRIAALTTIGVPIQIQDTLKGVAHQLDPKTFPYAPTSGQFLSQPVRSGLTRFRAQQAYDALKNEGRDDLAELVIVAAEQNHLKWGVRQSIPAGVYLRRNYRSKHRAQERREAFKAPRYDREGSTSEAPPAPPQ